MTDGKTIRAYGTSEGVRKAWDSRGRGRQAKPTSRNKSRIAGPSGLRILPVEEQHQPFTKEWQQEHGYPTEPLSPQKMSEGKRLVSDYKKLGDKILNVHKKFDNAEDVKSTWGRMLHFLKDVGDWHDAWTNVRDVVLEIAAGVFLLKNIAHAETVHTGLQHAYHMLAPVMHHLSMVVSSSGSHAGMFASEEKDFKTGSYSLRASVDNKVLAQW